MTDAEALAIYKAAFNRRESEGDPPEGHLDLVRRVVAAGNLGAATRILRDAGWWAPRLHAATLREVTKMIKEGLTP